jgi:mevalonate kinase
MRNYPAKLLLFGEHILLLGASALAVPIPYYYGQLVQHNSTKKGNALQKKMWAWAQSDQLAAVPGLDIRAFQTALSNGLEFQSNIPIGYGLGSSGALCAAVYDHFCTDKKEAFPELKRILSGMESFFHGSSSGIDPLTSYLNRPLLIHSTQNVVKAAAATWSTNQAFVFLMDSGLPRKAETMIAWFREQCKADSFQKWLESDYLPVNEKCLTAWLQADASTFWDALEQLSLMQFEKLRFLIPHTLQSFWMEGLENKNFFLKICGAGGGGFMLGFARDITSIEMLAKRHPQGHSVVKVSL